MTLQLIESSCLVYTNDPPNNLFAASPGGYKRQPSDDYLIDCVLLMHKMNGSLYCYKYCYIVTLKTVGSRHAYISS